jgi:hypothetical protein
MLAADVLVPLSLSPSSSTRCCSAGSSGTASVVHVDGPALPVQGLFEIAAMYRSC